MNYSVSNRFDPAFQICMFGLAAKSSRNFHPEKPSEIPKKLVGDIKILARLINQGWPHPK